MDERDRVDRAERDASVEPDVVHPVQRDGVRSRQIVAGRRLPAGPLRLGAHEDGRALRSLERDRQAAEPR